MNGYKYNPAPERSDRQGAQSKDGATNNPLFDYTSHFRSMFRSETETSL
ncbi:MAG: hypothetical protein HN390_04575 [Anaerolineae bacterium]|nr:hypothetical protein [Anaerolineae bacterium]MBT7991618.1 hypothetical protein [Anaerolineae bacterium]